MIREMIRAVRTYGREVRLILVVSALVAFAVDGVFPVIFNLYILRMGYGPEFVGQANSVALLAFSFSSLLAGTLGTRFGTRRMMVSGVAVTMAATWALSASDLLPARYQPWWIIVMFSMLYLGAAFYYVNSSPALVNALPRAEQPRVISVQSALNNVLAFAAGPIAGYIPVLLVTFFAWSIHDPATYRVPLLVSGGLLVVAALLIVSARARQIGTVHPSSAALAMEGGEQPMPSGEPAGAPTVAITFGSTLLVMSFIRFFTTAGSASALTFFNVYMDDALGVSTSTIGLVVAIAHLVAVFAALSVPAVTRRLGNGPAAVAGTVGVALSMLPLALFPFWQAAGFGFAAMYSLTSLRFSAFFVYMMDVTPPRLRTTMAGAGEFAGGLSFAFVSLAGGYIIVSAGYAWLFGGAALITLVGAISLWFYVRRHAAPSLVVRVPATEVAD